MGDIKKQFTKWVEQELLIRSLYHVIKKQGGELKIQLNELEGCESDFISYKINKEERIVTLRSISSKTAIEE